jgi:hypothetical protein
LQELRSRELADEADVAAPAAAAPAAVEASSSTCVLTRALTALAAALQHSTDALVSDDTVTALKAALNADESSSSSSSSKKRAAESSGATGSPVQRVAVWELEIAAQPPTAAAAELPPVMLHMHAGDTNGRMPGSDITAQLQLVGTPATDDTTAALQLSDQQQTLLQSKHRVLSELTSSTIKLTGSSCVLHSTASSPRLAEAVLVQLVEIAAGSTAVNGDKLLADASDGLCTVLHSTDKISSTETAAAAGEEQSEADTGTAAPAAVKRPRSRAGEGDGQRVTRGAASDATAAAEAAAHDPAAAAATTAEPATAAVAQAARFRAASRQVCIRIRAFTYC